VVERQSKNSYGKLLIVSVHIHGRNMPLAGLFLAVLGQLGTRTVSTGNIGYEVHNFFVQKDNGFISGL
jgi:hypothetical protein